ncbi:peptidoglycan endopeptidase [Sphingomonas sp. 2R-10]|uniref:peptidoglycan endopeptidase n=1 Tax=Sphingomonas sp. 2R-10 TaxID=3045148 RepID=UPI000F7A4160|nr:peptidoglycan endopeptidase [Sphingomonas sp. 2R-10]MDJ0276409.1 peptidoglycan endopeptidase [Sphingomonas sp. 2R-10]
MSAVARARSVVGCRFRRQGRCPDTGFDCVGLVAWAHGLTVPGDYPARGGDPARIAVVLKGYGFEDAVTAAAGDVLLLASGPGQLHLALSTGGGMIHADAVARAVVERPGPPRWPVLAVWRRSGG